jgi:1-acyl-sn-glycerol-3-phosphate acyltransferase
MIRTVAVVIYIVVALLLVMPWLLLWSLLTHDASLMYRAAMAAVRLANRIAGIRVRVEGLESIPPCACIFAANHISNVDPLAFIPAIPRRVSILVKKELFRIPILSAAMRLAQFVPVDRRDPEAAAASVDLAVALLGHGFSFAVYPEGTRSPDGRLRPFKKGAFVMAIQTGAPIVPVAISGAQHLMRKGDWTLHPGEVLVRFLPPIDPAPFTMDQRSDLLARVESAVVAALPPDQQPAHAPAESQSDAPAES